MAEPTRPIRVLHVDDEPDVVSTTAEYVELVTDRIRVETATSVATGLDRLEEGDIDCVVSDHDMPGTDGIEFLRRVREEQPKLPFILYTGKGSEEVASDAISAGVSDYLQKEGGTDQYALLANRITNLVGQYRAEQELERERHRFRKLFENTNDAVAWIGYREDPPVTTDHTPVIRQANPAFRETFEPPGEDVTGRPLDEVVSQGARREEAEAISREVLSGETRSAELTRDTVDGPRTFLWRAVVVESPRTGEIENSFAVYTDITELRQRERELERYRTLVETVGDPMYIIDTEGRIEMANAAMVDQLDADEEQVVGTSIAEFMVEDDFERGTEVIRSLLGSPERDWATFEMTAVSTTGRRIPAETNVGVLTDETGQYTGSVGVVRDIAERREHERQLDAAREAYQTLIEASPTPIWVQGVEEIRYANEAAAAFYGVDDPADLVGESVLRYVPEAEHEQVIEQNEAMLEEDEPLRELAGEIITRDGRRREAVFDAAPITYYGERAIVTFGRDVTERRHRARELERQNERLEEFAGVVSHDLRNPLGVAEGRLQLARQETDNEHLEAVSAAHDRMEAMIEDLLSLARAGRMLGELEPVALPEVVEDAWSSVDSAEARLEVETAAEVGSDPARLRQLFENLFRNAVEHAGGAVTLTVADLEDGFFVEDDGPGIPADERDRVLEPGYSTADRGSGYGLSIVREVAEAHGWDVTVTASADGGARFEFRDVPDR